VRNAPLVDETGLSINQKKNITRHRTCSTCCIIENSELNCISPNLNYLHVGDVQSTAVFKNLHDYRTTTKWSFVTKLHFRIHQRYAAIDSKLSLAMSESQNCWAKPQPSNSNCCWPAAAVELQAFHWWALQAASHSPHVRSSASLGLGSQSLSSGLPLLEPDSSVYPPVS